VITVVQGITYTVCIEMALAFIEGWEQAAIDCLPEIKATVFTSEDHKEGVRLFVTRRKAKIVGR
jgi:enoyl-CoA hydratase